MTTEGKTFTARNFSFILRLLKHLFIILWTGRDLSFLAFIRIYYYHVTLYT